MTTPQNEPNVKFVQNANVVFFFTVIGGLASLVSIYGGYLYFSPPAQTYSASGFIIDANGQRIPRAHFSYSIDRKTYIPDSSDASGGYKIQMQAREIVPVHFICRHGKESIDTSIKLVNPDNIFQNIVLVRSNNGRKKTIDHTSQERKNKKPEIQDEGTTQENLTTETKAPQISEMPDATAATSPPLPEYVLIPTNNGTEIPYYSDNITINSRVSPAGFLDHQTPLTTLFIPTESDTRSILFSFFSKDLNRPAKGWIKLENLSPRTHKSSP
ncbi:hypothetical protein [Dawidia soli]|uniref:Uncharacterized protein n=1 Tax=Dawidia soli TaxID=2782352 RepID=A0AAP2DBY6_9BACT|nr:hypothetical protein [Dawidia soli]MBT1689221.1 hypothetical protein [Dawidia soli]